MKEEKGILKKEEATTRVLELQIRPQKINKTEQQSNHYQIFE